MPSMVRLSMANSKGILASPFIEEKRVAVSMLQKNQSIDFDEACQVLDKLQEIGLIGPYLGGKTRDILLTREEWEAVARDATEV